MSAFGYKRRFRPRRRSDRSTPESRPSSGNVRFLGVEVRWRSVLETVSSGRSFRSMLKQSKEHEAASFGLIASLPPKADIRAASSALPPISSASPRGADLPGDAPVRLVLTHSGQTGHQRVMSASIAGSGRLARGSVRTGFSQELTFIKFALTPPASILTKQQNCPLLADA